MGGQPHDPIVITTHGGMSLITSRRAILVQGKAAGSQPGSTRSTVTPPSRGPSTPGATSTTREKAAGSYAKALNINQGYEPAKAAFARVGGKYGQTYQTFN